MKETIKKVTKKITPSQRQKSFAALYLEEMIKHGKVNKGRLLRKVGYTPATAKNPKDIMEKPSFKELLDLYMPEELVRLMHLELASSVNPEDRRFALKHADDLRKHTKQELVVRKGADEMSDEELEAQIREEEEKLGMSASVELQTQPHQNDTETTPPAIIDGEIEKDTREHPNASHKPRKCYFPRDGLDKRKKGSK